MNEGKETALSAHPLLASAILATLAAGIACTLLAVLILKQGTTSRQTLLLIGIALAFLGLVSGIALQIRQAIKNSRS